MLSECRLILEFAIGPRKQYVADKLVESVKKHLSDKTLLFVTDAQVVKIRINGILKKVEKKILSGKNIEQSEISTTLLETQNLTLRQDNNRVSRKTIGFSKAKEWLESQMRSYCMYFDFYRGHVGLRYKDEKGVECKNTLKRGRNCGLNMDFKEIADFQVF
ncbi:hypothetical protein MSKOL_3105 [Methanosarcina sp. Kolksee]|nr:hypothetical protein MSKOL_3105 [Methanosarcina sp. Kolksee]